MSKVYEINISTKIDDELLNIDGDIDDVKFLRAMPPEAVETIDWLVDVYDRTASGIFSRIIFRRQGPSLAWAYIFLDRDYAVADVMRDTLGDENDVKFANYSVLSHPDYPSEQYSIGHIWIKDKAALARLADKSVLWAECWRVLADVSATKRWIAILDPLPKDWSYDNENSNVLNMWHEVKAHSSSEKKSNEKH
jgi:hypothetical protein